MNTFEDPAVRNALLLAFILNPFAQVLYLSELIRKTEREEFRRLLGRASLMTWVILVGCAFVGDLVLFSVFQISIAAMRIFGGLINLRLSYAYLMEGPEGIKLFRGDVTELASQITLPVMVGAGTVWASIKIGTDHAPIEAALIISSVLAANFLFICGYHLIYKDSKRRSSLIIIKYFGMAMRINAMLIGAVSIEMILGGIRDYLNAGGPM